MKHALLISIDKFKEASFRQLISPSIDSLGLEEVLSNSSIGNFDVQRLVNCTSSEARLAIEKFYADRNAEDTLLTFFSGHGMRDALGRLFFICFDSNLKHLKSTTIPASFLSEAARESSSRKQIIIIDSCFSGAFVEGTKAAGESVKQSDILPEGRGQVVLTASTAYQYSFEGETINGKAQPSVFTQCLIKGLKTGAADIKNDGIVDVDELYSYLYKETTILAKQTPQKWVFGSEGTIEIAKNPAPRSSELPESINSLLRHDNARVRCLGVDELKIIATGPHLGMRLAALLKLQIIATEDNYLDVRQKAKKALADIESETKENNKAPFSFSERKAEPEASEINSQIKNRASTSKGNFIVEFLDGILIKIKVRNRISFFAFIFIACIVFFSTRYFSSSPIIDSIPNQVTDADVQAEYDKFIGYLKTNKEYKVRHILVDTEVQAKKIIADLKNGAKFEDVAKKQSKDPGSGANGGDLDWAAPESYVPEFSNAMVLLKPGETTSYPVKSQFGYHIIRIDGIRQPSLPSFVQIKDEIKRQLTDQRSKKLN